MAHSIMDTNSENNDFVLSDFKIRRISNDSIFIMGYICRISEFRNLFFKLIFLLIQIKKTIIVLYIAKNMEYNDCF